MKTRALVLCLACACAQKPQSPPPVAAAPPPVAAAPPPVAAAPPPVAVAPPPAVVPAPAPAPVAKAPAAEAAPAPPPATAKAPASDARAAAAERRARIAQKVAEKGVLGVLGASGGGNASDVLKGGDVSDALNGAGGVGSSQGLGSIGTVGKGSGGGGLAGLSQQGSGEMGSSGAPAPKDRAWPTLQGVPVPTTRKFLGPPGESLKTLGDVSKFIAATLEQHDYEEIGYFRYGDGFAIATRPERIDPDARPLQSRRWPLARVRHADEAKSVQALFEVVGEEGDRYRSFVFLCISGDDVDFSGGADQTWGLWKTGSGNPQGDTLLAQPVAAHKLYAFIYELSQEKGGKVLVAAASANTAAEHLRAAGLAGIMGTP